MEESVLAKKSKTFAIRIINLYKHLCSEKREFGLSKQILKSGTSIGANIREAKFAQSRNDYISKFSISLKESNETLYWLELLGETEYITIKEYESLYNDCLEILKMLQSTIITLKSNKDQVKV